MIEVLLLFIVAAFAAGIWYVLYEIRDDVRSIREHMDRLDDQDLQDLIDDANEPYDGEPK